ncbi:Membrane associated serine protease, rhomboid family [Ekhidna lutea]|uniref:Membrane associated serine protease, rhomboid family n=1 Tax=Ekhidna lutea TaxID=447679 RepID=A0A239IJE7_EKHLU|nr:rhomboid family intramembrane serine protease [Ekhidna lutea]SNS93770.1 Membrane associated serine protease, rhomboid family [Ekhidna lutea]
MNGGIKEEFSNAWSKPNNAVVQIIIINVVIFLILLLLQIFLPASIFEEIHKHFVIPPLFDRFIFRPYTIMTYGFTHSLTGIFHILFNMYVFYIFGRLINEYLGSNKVLSLYVLGAIGGGILYLLAYNLIPTYNNSATNTLLNQPDWGMVGASAAVYAVVVAAATKMPNYTFHLLLFGPVRIKYIAFFVIVLSLVGINANSNFGGNVAHLGGALVGWIYISQLNKGTDIGSWVISFIQFVKSMFKPQPKIKVTHRSGSRRPSAKKAGKNTTEAGKTPQAEIDAILDKISEKGYESLSKDEKQKLFNASKK